ncbi:hypothetical protein Tco_0212630 [Tanacetum coccineum]
MGRRWLLKGMGAGIGVGVGVVMNAEIGVGVGVGMGASIVVGVGVGIGAGIGVGVGVVMDAEIGVGVGVGMGAGIVVGVGVGMGAGICVGVGVGMGAGIGGGDCTGGDDVDGTGSVGVGMGAEVKAYLRLEPRRKSIISANPALSSVPKLLVVLRRNVLRLDLETIARECSPIPRVCVVDDKTSPVVKSYVIDVSSQSLDPESYLKVNVYRDVAVRGHAPDSTFLVGNLSWDLCNKARSVS